MTSKANPRQVARADRALVDRLTARHTPYPEAVSGGSDIIGDPHREIDEGFNWTVLRRSRKVADVLPGSEIIIGSAIGTCPAEVVAWDFEASDYDPMVVLGIEP